MSLNMFNDVQVFADIGGSPNLKTDPREKVIEVCKRLIAEETEETLDAIAFYKQSGSLEHLAEAVDGAIDTIYVCIFFLNQMGIDGQAHWNLVQERNMAKFPGGIALKNEHGKIQKPEGWFPPNHLPLLIEWNSKMRGETYVGGLVRAVETKENRNAS
jgi:NTP pyrophosphatase (non-canonical NTP hydrolase)